MVEQIYSLIYAVFMVFLLIQFGRIFSVSKSVGIVKLIGIMIEWSIILNVISYLVDNVFLRLILIILLAIIHYMFIFKNTIVRNIVLSTIITSVIFVVDYLMFSLSYFLVPNMTMDNIFSYTISYYLSIGSQMVQFIIIIIIAKCFSNTDTINTPNVIWIRYLAVPIFTIVFIGFIIASVDNSVGNKIGKALIILAIGLIALNILVFVFLKNDINRQLEAERGRQLYSHAKELQDVYQQLNTERNRLAAENHEFKNLVSSWRALLEEGEYSKLDKMLIDVDGRSASRINVISTGNITFDTVINAKYYEAIDKGISFDFVLDDLSEITLDDADLIILVSNVYNNAIEACVKAMKTQSSRSEISTKCIIKHNTLFFTVRNTFNGHLNKDMSTTKQDRIRHGYGISAIKGVIAKHGGKYYTETDNDSFTTYVIIPV